MNDPVELVLSKLPDAKRSSGGWKAFCPAHNDTHKESLSIRRYPDGSCGVKCFAGCPTDSILGALGLERKHLFPRKPGEGDGKPVVQKRVHTYRDERGRPVQRKTVAKHPDGKKFANWEHSVDGGANWIEKQGDGRYLYNYPEVLEAIRAGKPVYLNEGEKGADACMVAGVCGTSHGMGAGNFDEAFARQLTGAKVVVVADKDEPGEAWARYKVAPVLRRFAKAVAFVESATKGPGDDAWDHFSQGFKLSQLVKRPDLSGVPAAETVVYNGTFQPVALSYLWQPYIPAGKMVLLDADGGVGKSSLALAVAACLSQGIVPPVERIDPAAGPSRCAPAKTLYLHRGEDGDDELETVYRACGGVEGSIAYCTSIEHLDARGCAVLEQTIRETGATLVVVDALMYFLSFLRDGNQSIEVGPVLQRIANVYAATGASGVHIRHTGKTGASNTGRATSDMGLGSVQFRNSHRGQLVARWHPEMRGVVVVQDLKGSILNPRGESFAYRRAGHAVEFLPDVEDPWARPGSTEDPREWLIALLAKNPGGLDSAFVKRAATAAGLWSAVRKLQGVAVKTKSGYQGEWIWKLSPDIDPFDEPGETRKEQPAWWTE